MILNSITGQFELTPYCNLDCKMCYIHDSSEVGRTILPASFWIDQAKQAVEQGMLVLSITGGESLLYPELDELMTELSKMGLLISFNTNGTLVDEKRVEWFEKYWPNKINISLYGASDKVYEKLCGIKDGFTRVSGAIDLLMNSGFNVYLNGMITPENIRELPEMHRFAADRGLILHLSSYAFPLRSKPGLNARGEHRFSPEEAARAMVYNQKIVYGTKKFAYMGATSLEQIDLHRQGILRDVCRECNGGISNFQISYDGQLHTCAMLTKLAVPLESYTFAEGWDLLKRGMKEIAFPDKCIACDRKNICPMCKGAVYLETGNITEAPEYLCRYSEELERILRKECAGVQVSLQHSGNLNSSHCEF